MGNTAAKSENFTSATINAIQRSTNEVENKCVQSGAQFAGNEIDFSKAPECKGVEEINVRNSNTMKFRDLDCTFDTFFKQENEQQLAAMIEQIAKSQAEGVAAPGAESTNVIVNGFNALMESTNKIKNTCKQNASQYSGEKYKNLCMAGKDGGRINIVNENDVEFAMDCTASTVGDISAVQRVDSRMKQVATSLSKGMNPLMLLLVILLPIAFLAFSSVQLAKTGVNLVFKFIGPLMMLAGLVLEGLYWGTVVKSGLGLGRWSTDKPQVLPYSRGLSGGNCTASGPDDRGTRYSTYQEALDAFMKEEEFEAFDYVSYDVKKDNEGKDVPVKKSAPQTIFYRSACKPPMLGTGGKKNPCTRLEEPLRDCDYDKDDPGMQDNVKIAPRPNRPKENPDDPDVPIEGHWPVHWDVATDGTPNTSTWRVTVPDNAGVMWIAHGLTVAGIVMTIIPLLSGGKKKAAPAVSPAAEE